MSEELTKVKRPQMDWLQVALNGGPPCFAVIDGEGRWYCGRAEQWGGHGSDHIFVSLDDLLTTLDEERERCARIALQFKDSSGYKIPQRIAEAICRG